MFWKIMDIGFCLQNTEIRYLFENDISDVETEKMMQSMCKLQGQIMPFNVNTFGYTIVYSTVEIICCNG